MELLWSFTGEAAPQGDIGKKEDAEIR